jgi:hypothetical protein
MDGLRRFRRSSIDDVPSACGGQKDKGSNGGDERGGTHVPFGRHRLRLIGWHRRRHRFRLHRLADFERVDADGFSDVLQLGCAEVDDLEIEPTLDLSIGVLGQADRSGFGDAFQPRRDIHAVAHQVAVGSLDHVAKMNTDAEFDALRRHSASASWLLPRGFTFWFNRQRSQARGLLFFRLAQPAVAVSPAPYKPIIGSNSPRPVVERV